MSPSIYESDPHPAPDADFVPGELAYLVAGNRGRLLDARRTPVAVTGVKLETAVFEVEVRAFEDAGARWELPAEDAGRFQFARDSSRAPDVVVAALERAAARFDRPGDIECEPGARQATLRRLAGERERARRWVDGLRTVDVAAIVLAELGLCPYRGKVVRDARLFAGAWAKPRRAEHLLARMAFTQEIWSRLGATGLPLYRAAATDGPPPARRPASFVSATFSKEVATAHFEGGPTTRFAALWRRPLPLHRLLMTFLETELMNRAFSEAEAVLIGDPANRAL